MILLSLSISNHDLIDPHSLRDSFQVKVNGATINYKQYFSHFIGQKEWWEKEKLLVLWSAKKTSVFFFKRTTNKTTQNEINSF